MFSINKIFNMSRDNSGKSNLNENKKAGGAGASLSWFKPSNYDNLQGVNLAGADLVDANLKDANLKGAHLEGAHLEGANLEGANLEGADLADANLKDANLKDANLNKANLSRACLYKANLAGAHLEGANLEGANLEGANLEGANLNKAKLSGACLNFANLSKANLAGTNLMFARLYGVDLKATNLKGAFLYRVNLSGADLSGADLNGFTLMGACLGAAHLEGADLSGADLEGANIEIANLEGANLNKANLAGANLEGANLAGAHLDGANLDGVNLKDANLNCSNLFCNNPNAAATLDDTLKYLYMFCAHLDGTLKYANLEGAKLIGAKLVGYNLEGVNLMKADLLRVDLKGANLSGACLNFANLEGANLSGANLYKANLEGANLKGANLKGANLSGANLSGACLNFAHLDGANLSGANLYKASLDGANLSGANLSGANLSGACLDFADLNLANLDGANLSGAHLDRVNLLDIIFNESNNIKFDSKSVITLKFNKHNTDSVANYISIISAMNDEYKEIKLDLMGQVLGFVSFWEGVFLSVYPLLECILLDQSIDYSPVLINRPLFANKFINNIIDKVGGKVFSFSDRSLLFLLNYLSAINDSDKRSFMTKNNNAFIQIVHFGKKSTNEQIIALNNTLYSWYLENIVPSAYEHIKRIMDEESKNYLIFKQQEDYLCVSSRYLSKFAHGEKVDERDEEGGPVNWDGIILIKNDMCVTAKNLNLYETFETFEIFSEKYLEERKKTGFTNLLKLLNLGDYYNYFVAAIDSKVSATKLIDSRSEVKLNRVFSQFIDQKGAFQLVGAGAAVITLKAEHLKAILNASEMANSTSDDKAKLFLLLSGIFAYYSSSSFFGTEEASPNALRYYAYGLMKEAHKLNSDDAIVSDANFADWQNRLLGIQNNAFTCTAILSSTIMSHCKSFNDFYRFAWIIPLAWQ